VSSPAGSLEAESYPIQPMPEYVVVINDCAAAAATGGPISIRTRSTAFGQQNFVANYSPLADGLSRQLVARELDWIETIIHLFAIDLACARGEGDLEWARSITAHVPVRDPAYWSTKANTIESIFGDFTYDRLKLHFEDDPDPLAAPRQSATAFEPFDCVALLSGGVDSFVGAAALQDDKRIPLCISHVAAGAIGAAQTAVAGALSSVGGPLKRVGITVRKHGPSFPNPESSQRSRSFMFLAAALLVAAVEQVEDVFINENGVMAIHLPMTSARLGSLSTHTASPVTVERVGQLAADVLGSPLNIGNNLLAETKPEVVERGCQLGHRDALQQTVSCWAIGRTARHCGVCAPCLMRRISFETHGVPDAVYLTDAFGDEDVLDHDFACDNLVHMLRLVADITNMSDIELQVNYPEVLNGGSALPLADVLDLHRRWAAQASAVLMSQPVPARL